MGNKRLNRTIGMGFGAALMAAALATGVVADGPDGSFGARSGRMGMGMGLRGLRALNLTQDQKDKIKAAFVARRPALQALRQTAQANRQALATLTKAANPDPAAVGAAYLKVLAGRQALVAQRQQAQGDVVALLTPDQKTQLQQMSTGWGFGFHTPTAPLAN
jgi:Spy/CpxP family protein refolding chaperone